MTRMDIFGYEPDKKYEKSVAYFSMEFAIDQALKIYSGGLGFLAGSHLRSAYELKQNLFGIGILWKYGYYDQERDTTAVMKPSFTEKTYSFLTDTGIVFTVPVHSAHVYVKALLLKPRVFGSAPLFLLTTDIPENDFVSRTITNRLYDSNEATRIAQSIILGTGGARLIDALGLDVDIYHMNEGHSLSLNFYLYSKYKNLAEVKKRVAFTTHTPEKAGNEEHKLGLLQEMTFFYDVPPDEVKDILKVRGDSLDYTLAALKFAKIANGVSKLHGEVARKMWNGNEGICEITSITNAQNKNYWKDEILEKAILSGDDEGIRARKKEMKRVLFKEVANQCGKIFDENVLTIVWARRFAGYKRADLLMYNFERFLRLLNKEHHQVQVIWAGKPYPEDYGAIGMFNQIINKVKYLPNCAVLTGYELGLSALLKKGSDVWLNNPRMYREASGTSGMTAAMNASVNLSIPDGWIPEFARDKENIFLIPTAPDSLPQEEKDRLEAEGLLEVLENTVLPMYYDEPEKWVEIIKTAAKEITPAFESGRMADEYYEKIHSC